MSHETETGAWPEATVTSKHGGSTSAHIDQSVNKTMPWIALLAIVSGVSLGLALHSAWVANIAERETRLQRLEVDELRAALALQGINPGYHAPTDKP